MHAAALAGAQARFWGCVRPSTAAAARAFRYRLRRFSAAAISIYPGM